MTEEEFTREATAFIRELIASRDTDKFGFAVFGVLHFAVKSGRTKEMYAILKDFGSDLRGKGDWPDVLL